MKNIVKHATTDMARALGQRLLAGGRAWLFLDYDGTLAQFAPTPEHILPDPELIRLLKRLTQPCTLQTRLWVVIISGRTLSQVQALVPLPGVLLAGTYGIEYQTWKGENVQLLDMQSLRPVLDQVKQAWRELTDNRPGYYIEDKGYSLALHAKNASLRESPLLMSQAEQAARQIKGVGAFQVQSEGIFLEVAPKIADKGVSLHGLVDRYAWDGAEIIYIGDDNKDEAAFEVVRQMGGIPILVASADRPTHALYRLPSTSHVRVWLSTLAETLEQCAG